MQLVASVHQIRDAEQAWFDAHPGEDLMQRAAAHVAAAAREMLGDQRPGRVLVVAGGGNNGGDGLFAARDLANDGCQVAIWCTGSSAHDEGLEAAREAGCVVVEAAEAIEGLSEVDLVIDAVLGIGGRAGLREPVDVFAQACTDLGVAVLSVDIPSGLAADEVGSPDSVCFHATRTITFAAVKLCHVAEPAASRCGLVQLADIGLDMPEGDVFAAQPVDIAQRWPYPGPLSDKYSRGVVGIDTGSPQYPGAGVLSTIGALYSGAGMVRFCGDDATASRIGNRMPSIVFGDGRVQAWVLGCGWGNDDDSDTTIRDKITGQITGQTPNQQRIARRLGHGLPTVIDADALSVLPDELPAGCLLTPHAGELARLLGIERSEVTADPLGSARRLAGRSGAVVLLKGATQYIVEPSGRVTLAVPGPAWTAQAGSGDTLAGICGTLLAAGLEPRWAGVLAASAQAMTATIYPGTYPPDVMAEHLPELIAELEDEAHQSR